jgi:uncharacterized repeat protein (TIGR01451 family)
MHTALIKVPWFPINMNVFSDDYAYWTDPNMSNKGAQATVHIGDVADLNLTKSAAPNLVYIGSFLIYTLTAINNGPSTAENVVVKDWLPEGVSVNSIGVTVGSYIAAVARYYSWNNRSTRRTTFSLKTFTRFPLEVEKGC